MVQRNGLLSTQRLFVRQSSIDSYAAEVDAYTHLESSCGVFFRICYS